MPACIDLPGALRRALDTRCSCTGLPIRTSICVRVCGGTVIDIGTGAGTLNCGCREEALMTIRSKAFAWMPIALCSSIAAGVVEPSTPGPTVARCADPRDDCLVPYALRRGRSSVVIDLVAHQYRIYGLYFEFRSPTDIDAAPATAFLEGGTPIPTRLRIEPIGGGAKLPIFQPSVESRGTLAGNRRRIESMALVPGEYEIELGTAMAADPPPGLNTAVRITSDPQLVPQVTSKAALGARQEHI
jgi:hypothetical protein